MSLKRKRTNVPLATKYEIVQLPDQKMTQSEIDRWYRLVQSSVSSIFKNRMKIKEDFESCGNPDQKWQRSGKNSQLNDALRVWFQAARQRDIPISSILQEKASKYAKQLNVPDFNASNRWLSQFKTRENIAFKKLHGEKKDAYTDAAQQWISKVLPEITRQYNP